MKLLPGKTKAPGLLGAFKNLYKKHPVATTLGTATAIGSAAAAPKALEESKQLENQMMESYVGAPGGKYVYAELQNFSRRKRFLGEKLALCKLAVDYSPYQSIESGFTSGIGKGLATSGIEGIGKLIRGTARSLQERLVLDKQREALVDHIMQNDPIVSIQEQNNPGSTIKAYSTMARFAPTLSLDPNVATSFLREASQSEGGINPLTVQQLANTEQSVTNAQGRSR